MGLADSLRAATWGLHVALESRLGLPGDVPSYRVLLENYLGFYEPWEAAVGPVLEAALPGFFGPRRKCGLLRRDLEYLGAPPANSYRSSAPWSAPALPAALGEMYVLEGATLGGRVLLRHVESALGLTPETGAAFFAGYRERTGAMWSAFRVVLERHGSERESVPAAVRMFQRVGEWLGPGAREAACTT